MALESYMGIGITPNKEEGKCSVCKKKTEVRKIFDAKKKKGFSICQKCADKSELTIGQGVKKYGKPM
jgi:transcription elongation factor Elf1